jgi:RimJ/RimL family protein N-acetyltransferase
MRIEGEHITLRSWMMEDLPALVKHADNFNIWINLRDGFPHPYTEEAGRNWLDMALAEDHNILLAIEMDGEAAGGIGAHFHSDVYRINCEIGYWLSESLWGRGIMTEAVSMLTEHIFSHYPDIVRIYADIFSFNPASGRVLEKCGFHREAVHKNSVIKNHQIADEFRYVLFRTGAL